MYEIAMKICTIVSGTAGKNDDCYRKGREGGGQRVMIEIIRSVNDEDNGRPLKLTKKKKSSNTKCNMKVSLLQIILRLS